MAFKIEVGAATGVDGTHFISAKYSDVISLMPDFILHEIVRRIAEKFVEEHYSEIEKELDVKLIAAVVSAHMGSVVDEKMQKEVERVRLVAEEALRRSKKRIF